MFVSSTIVARGDPVFHIGGDAILIFLIIFPENPMELKKIGSVKLGGRPPEATLPFESANSS